MRAVGPITACDAMATSRSTKPGPTRKAAAPPPRRPAAPGRTRAGRRFAARALLHLTVAAALIGGLGYAAVVSRGYIERSDLEDGPTALSVVLANRPAWMSDYLAGQIAAAVPNRPTSPFDHAALVTAVARLRASPWVRDVRQVRRTYGNGPGDTLVVDCEYRAPAALVKAGDDFWLVDNDGFKLPDPFAAAQLPRVTAGGDGRTTLRVVTGVAQPPPAVGRKWAGADVVAALDTAKLLYGKPYLDEVTGIDVSNFAGRIDRHHPQVVLATRYGTSIWWGRPPLAADFYVEASVAKKLAMLSAVVRQYGRVDGGKPWIDVRFDTGLLPADP